MGRRASPHLARPRHNLTFTFLDRNAILDVALSWKDSLAQVAGLRILTVTPADLGEAWPYFQRRDLHKLSAVDATSFVLMSHEKIRAAFTFDHHFAMAGFRLVGELSAQEAV